MAHIVATKHVQSEIIAAVRDSAFPPEIPHKFKPALDQVWAFLKGGKSGLKAGHNLFLYHHPSKSDVPMQIDFGVQVDKHFEPHGNVRAVEVPAGEVAWTLHTGPYSGLPAAHQAVHAWARENKRPIGSMSWETYGDWTEDERKLETWICYLVR